MMPPSHAGRNARRLALALLIGIEAFGPGAAPAAADAVEDFYKGRTLRIVIGYAAGGGYDLYGRVFAEHFGKYLPGHPTIVPQNMPGAGSFLAARYLHDVAPRDGTTFGCVSQTLPLDAAMKADNDLDVTSLPYLGRLVDNVDIGLGSPGAWFSTFADARARQIIVGATGGSSAGYLVPAALLAYSGAKFKIVSGYGGSNDVLLAMERREVELIGAVGLPGVMQRNLTWITERKAPVLYQTALKRHAALPHVPTLEETGLDDKGRAVLRAIAASADIGRSIITTPGVPAARLAALRQAFEAMMADPQLAATLQKRDIMLGPAPGEALDQITREVVRTPRPVLDSIQALMSTGGK